MDNPTNTPEDKETWKQSPNETAFNPPAVELSDPGNTNFANIFQKMQFSEGKVHLHLSAKQFMNCIYRITTLVLGKVGAGVSVIGCKLSLGSVKKLPNLYSEKGLRALSSVG